MADIQVELPTDRIEAFCRKWRIQQLWLFGSALRDDFRADSDVDFLVKFAAGANWSLWDHAGMELELEEMLGRHVDLISHRGIERSQNWIRRRAILNTARSIYRAS